jgi:hypothetical protein
MFEIFQAFNRAILAILTGGMFLFGTAFWADWIGGCNSVWNTTISMLQNPAQKIILTAIIAVTAYIIGMINIAGSALLFGSFANANRNGELLLINRIESIHCALFTAGSRHVHLALFYEAPARPRGYGQISTGTP